MTRLYNLYHTDKHGNPILLVGGGKWKPMTHQEAMTARSKFPSPVDITLVEADQIQFQVGQRVKVIPSAFCTRRISYVSQVDVGSDGQYRYWLADGGLFSNNELEAY